MHQPVDKGCKSLMPGSDNQYSTILLLYEGSKSCVMRKKKIDFNSLNRDPDRRNLSLTRSAEARGSGPISGAHASDVTRPANGVGIPLRTQNVRTLRGRHNLIRSLCLITFSARENIHRKWSFTAIVIILSHNLYFIIHFHFKMLPHSL